MFMQNIITKVRICKHKMFAFDTRRGSTLPVARNTNVSYIIQNQILRPLDNKNLSYNNNITILRN